MIPILRPLVLVAALAAAAPSLAAQSAGQPGQPPRVVPGLELWVSGYHSNTVHRFSVTAKGTELGNLGSVPGAQSVRQGPAGLYYVVAEKRDEVRRYRRSRFVDLFVWDDPNTTEDETGGLAGATAALFGPDGHLYVAGFDSDAVHRYDGFSGAYMGDFVSPGDGGLDGPDAGMIFGPDGDLYVPSFNSSDVLRYSGLDGTFLDVFIPAGRSNLTNPRVLIFMPDGDVLVSSWGSNRVLRFDSAGNFLEEVVTYQRPSGIAIGPHTGYLYVTSDTADRVWKYDLVQRVKLGTIVPVGAAGLVGATYIRFVEPWGPGGLPLPTK